MKTPTNRLIDEYVRRLDRALRGVPRARRHEVVEEIAAHIADARAEAGGLDEAATRTLLDRLGEPEDIAAEAKARFGTQMRRPGGFEVTAVVLLLVGGFVFGVGWLAGVVMLWTSDVWTLRDKLIGTLVVPGGLVGVYAIPFLVLAVTNANLITGCSTWEDARNACPPDPSTLAVVAAVTGLALLLVSPFVTAWWLMRQARRPVPAVAFA